MLFPRLGIVVVVVLVVAEEVVVIVVVVSVVVSVVAAVAVIAVVGLKQCSLTLRGWYAVPKLRASTRALGV